MREYFSRVRAHARYTKQELITIIGVSFVIGFCYSFNKWGYVSFDPFVGATNLLRYTIYALITVLAMDLARKLYAVRIGYTSEIKLWNVGVLIALVISFVTQGSAYVWFLFGVWSTKLQHLQYGRLQRGYRPIDPAKIAFAGLLAGLGVCAIFGLIATKFPHVREAMIINAFIVLFCAIPLDLFIKLFDKSIPVFPGTAILVGSKIFAVFTLLVLSLGYIAIIVIGGFWVFVTAMLAAIIGTGYYYYTYEL